MRRRALSAVYGFVVLYLLIVAAISAFADLSGSQAAVSSAVQRQAGAVSAKQGEHLSISLVGQGAAIANDGSLPATVSFLLVRDGAGVRVEPLGATIPVGSNESVPFPAGASALGALTSMGNVFWLYAGSSSSVPNSCPAGVSTVTMTATPPGGGAVTPSGVQVLCTGQLVQLDAEPAPGYAFSSWRGLGNGSYTGTDDPATANVSVDISEEASFMPAVLISLFPSADGFAAGSAIARTAVVKVAGQPQQVTLSAPILPSGVSVTFSPDVLTDSLSGANSTMSVTYSGGSYGSNATLKVIASGSDGLVASADYVLAETPGDGVYSTSSASYPYGARTQASAFITGRYYQFWDTGFPLNEIDYSVVAPAGSSWVSLGTRVLSSDCVAVDNPVSVFQAGGALLIASSTGIGTSTFSFNYATPVAGALQFALATSSSCSVGQSVATKYHSDYSHELASYVSVVEDSEGNVWVAVATYSSPNYYLEVLEMPLAQAEELAPRYPVETWNEPYLSPPLAGAPIPQLFSLPNGDIALVYTLASSPCYGDFLLYTTDGGATWNGPAGPIDAAKGGSPLCSAASSGTALGDTVYFGGVDSLGGVGYWSFDLDTKTTAGGQVAPSGETYGGLTSAGGSLAMVYYSSASPSSSFTVAWSQDAGRTWAFEKVAVAFVGPVSIPARSEGFQVLVAGQRAGSYLQDLLFTV